LTYKGVKYPSVAALARAHNIETYIVHSRLKLGWTTAQAVGEKNPPKRKHGPQPIKCGGVTYESMSAMAREFGLSPSLVKYRLDQGMSPEEAVIHDPSVTYK
jgi:hypothetical protein